MSIFTLNTKLLQWLQRQGLQVVGSWPCLGGCGICV